MKKTSATMKLNPTEKQPIRNSEYISSFYDMVKEFHQVFEHPIESNEVTADMFHLRANLIREEAKEGVKAINENDSIEILDAAGDTVYVLTGTLVMLGGSLSHALAFDYKKESLTKNTQHNLSSGFMDDMKSAFEHSIYIADQLELLADNMDRGNVVTAIEDLVLFPAAIADALHLFNFLLSISGVDLAELTATIHESNMSKLWSSDATIRREQVENCKYDADDLAFRTCTSRDGVIGYRISDGKILKSPSYTPVDLTPFLKQCTELA
ncbi:nucleoside triphosphate pyrophosphohydrolase family protein [Xenorhabdus sp. PR6a]|uniref:nucleoside triphosphate pyrophosphohydrolase family protein n=1 Tax=Xenorhabdus sp. PR6a TaxID=3025877 RepID=UPI0023583278|nr:nucleoside triphosphate pyrophosphohydrolase family protein [Xenorhabdus sp. PR6a]MDC9581925.1 nucleoside triphosphate pyrophosphohydrolase family protein [Xenorhabdus sp. PR6a]